MKLIVAVDNNWAIGCKGHLLVSIPNDQKNFAMETTGKVVIYGRKTMETFPGGQPLRQRTNIVLSRNPGFKVKGAEKVCSVEALLEKIKAYPSDDVYVVGGEEVYRELLPYCDTALVTRIDYKYEADAYFPDLDADSEWRLEGESDIQTYFDIEYTYLKYKRMISGR
ncbi:dihydrofolate reductase [Lachnospiraceae bacterium XPB1003]|nr:dihydrofolate reductase [Lachnospiraceae bacterium XPB1003]